MGFETISGESVLRQSAANYQKGLEAVGGKLFLTTHRLFFESHKINVQTGGLGIDLREVVSVTPAWTKLLGLIPIVPNSFAIKTTQGQVHSFVIGGRGAWIAAIQEAAQNRATRR